MMTDEQMLAAYETLAQLSRLMLASTELGQWDQMTAQQDELSLLLDMLSTGEGTQPRPATVLAIKKALIEDILVTQKASLDRALPWRASLAEMLDSAGSARRMAHAYGQAGK
jgi:hypothetical protein